MAEGKCKAAPPAQTWGPAWRAHGSPLLLYKSFPLRPLLAIYNESNLQYNPFPTLLLPNHMYFSQRSLRKNPQVKETPRDTHDSRGPLHAFLKYMTPDMRFPLFSSFEIPSLKCIPICAFSSEHQTCKLLFQAKKSLKEVTPQRTGSAHFLRGSYYVEYPPETKCSHPGSHPVSHFFWHQSCFSGYMKWQTHVLGKGKMNFFFPPIPLSQPKFLSILLGSNRLILAMKADYYYSVFGTLPFTHTEALNFGWLFCFPRKTLMQFSC